jgi:inward rectifier potassium channel
MTTNPNPEPTSQTTPSPRNLYAERAIQWRNVGLQRSYLVDAYYYLLAASWPKLFTFAFFSYITINLLFASLYSLHLAGLSNATSFADAFFFSVQTFSTIGYGSISPTSLYTNIIVTLEAFTGLIAVALTTGIIFAKFSRPTAALRFSDKAVIHDENGIPHLHLRLANERYSEILNAHLTLSALIEQTSNEGITMRRIHRLHLVRDDIPLFAMAWTIMHPLDENSPLYGLTAENIAHRLLLLIITIEGTEATFMQTVQSRHFYRPQDIEFNRQFQDMILPAEDGKGSLELHHQNLHRTVPLGGWIRPR